MAGALMSGLPLLQPAFRLVRIIVCDEQSIFRHGLRRLLETNPAFRIVGETNVKATVLSMVSDLEPDIVLLGVPRLSGVTLTALEQVIAVGPSVRIILLTGSMDSAGVNAALKLGAASVVPKDAEPDVLFESIDSVMAGQVCVGRDHVTDLAASVKRFDAVRRETKAFGLTSRELEIVEAVVAGETNKAIAKRFSISENTVKRHLMNIYDKVGASSRLELAIFAAYHQLITAI
jgi:two-component system, NarL family, nitrate/nitrite response regulator NarL